MRPNGSGRPSVMKGGTIVHVLVRSFDALGKEVLRREAFPTTLGKVLATQPATAKEAQDLGGVRLVVDIALPPVPPQE